MDAAATKSRASHNKADKRKKKSSSSHHKEERKRDRVGSEAAATAKSLTVAPAVAPMEGDNENWDANHVRVESLCVSGPNHLCADCGEPGTRWASVNHGVFVCIRCSGIHRSLGVHISKVKSTSMDRWTAAEVALMETIGNRRGKLLYEVNMGATQRPTAASPDTELRAFVEKKYVQRAFAVGNLRDALKRAYKQVGYGKYYCARVGEGNATDAAIGSSSSSMRATGEGAGKRGSRRDPKTLREEAMKSLYGEGAAAKMTAPKQRQRRRQQVSPQRQRHSSLDDSGSNGDRGEEPAALGPVSAAAGSHDRGRKSKTVHGPFGIVNVRPSAYDTRRREVLAAFRIEEEEEEEVSGPIAQEASVPLVAQGTSESTPVEVAAQPEAVAKPVSADDDAAQWACEVAATAEIEMAGPAVAPTEAAVEGGATLAAAHANPTHHTQPAERSVATPEPVNAVPPSG